MTYATIETRHARTAGDVIVTWGIDEQRVARPLSIEVQPTREDDLIAFMRDVAADPRLIRHAVEAYETLGEPFMSGPPILRPGTPTRHGRPLAYGDEHLARVVRDYRRLLAVGHPHPVDFIAVRCNVTRGAVSGWIRVARRRGWLRENERVAR